VYFLPFLNFLSFFFLTLKVAVPFLLVLAVATFLPLIFSVSFLPTRYLPSTLIKLALTLLTFLDFLSFLSFFSVNNVFDKNKYHHVFYHHCSKLLHCNCQV